MRAPSATFRGEDFPDLTGRDQLDRFLRLLNSFCGQTEQFAKDVAKRVEFKTVTVTSDAFKDKGLFLRHDLGAAPQSVTVGQAFDLGASGKDLTPVALSNPAWTNGTQDNVRGVWISTMALFSGAFDPAHRYRITFRVEV